MHECPECCRVCYCDLDDSNDCRDRGECFHRCPIEEDEDLDDAWSGASCPGCGEPVNVSGETCGALECGSAGGKRFPAGAEKGGREP